VFQKTGNSLISAADVVMTWLTPTMKNAMKSLLHLK